MNKATLLFRQIHPNFLPKGEVSSQAFFPFPKDDGKLSVYDGDQIGAAVSHSHYTAQLRLESAGVWALNGDEVDMVLLRYLSDPVPGNPAHAVVNFGDLNERECRKLSKKLKRFAIERGCMYRPE